MIRNGNDPGLDGAPVALPSTPPDAPDPAPAAADLQHHPQAAGPIVAATPPPLPTGTLWRVGDAAAFLRCSERKLYEMLKTPATEPGSIPHLHLPGRALRFIPADLEAWVRDGCPPAATFAKWHRRK